MASERNKQIRDRYEILLKENSNFILSRYSGLSVADMTALRKKLYQYEVSYTVIKNNIFKIALQNSKTLQKHDWDNTLSGPIAVTFTKDEFPTVAKELLNYGKVNEKTEMYCGVMGDVFYSKEEMEMVASLPSREQVMAMLMASLNSPVSRLASIMRQVITGVACGIEKIAQKQKN